MKYMIGMVGVGRSVGSVALFLNVLMGSMNAFSYGNARTHLEVTEAMLGGYGGDDFQKFFEVTSGAIDSMAEDLEAHFPEMTKKFNPITYQAKIIGVATEMTGLARDQAAAFAALVIDLHQLQDLEPDNRAVMVKCRPEGLFVREGNGEDDDRRPCGLSSWNGDQQLP